jgi:3,4-dihydroxy 2-butanone 4-phosphate synthase/GTP cyclohydrolase II
VIVEILNDDGAMARRDDLIKFARRHDLKIGTIADLIEYRLRTEQSVEIIGEADVTTEFGAFRLVCFEDHVNRAVHLALVRGRLGPKVPTLVRVHRQDTLSDVLGLSSPMLHRPLRDALRLIAEQDHGVAVILRPEESARDLLRSVQSLSQPPEPDVGARRQRSMDFRTFGIGAQILRVLGVRRMRVIGAPKHMHALSGFGLEVVEYVSDAAEREDSHG